MTHDDIRRAQRLARAERLDGKVLTDTERRLIAQAVEQASPENFYMDGELFV